MRQVYQRFPNDCGVACVAMLAGVSYRVALEAIWPHGAPYRRLTTTKQLRQAMDRLGWRSRSKGLRDYHRYVAPQGVRLLLKVRVTWSTKNWHWCVQAPQGQFMDPERAKHSLAFISSYMAFERIK